MRNLIPDFPREIAYPSRRLVKTESEFYEKIVKYNKLKHIYWSIYSCNDKRNFDNTHLNKIFFDFDVDEKSTEPMKTQQENLIKQVKKMSDYFKEKDYKHLITFSGRKGFHVYLFTTKYENLVHKKDCIYNAYNYFIETLKINPDPHCKDLRRISRVPNTWHMIGKRYCIPIRRYDLEQGFGHIKEKARKQNFEFKYYGGHLFDISKFDYARPMVVNGDVPEYKYELSDTDKVIKRFLPCVQCWLLNIDNMGNWRARYYFAVYCRDMGIPKSMCNRLAKKYFGKIINRGSLHGRGSNYKHFCQCNALRYAYERGDLFPNCAKLFEEKLCKGTCKKYNSRGSPLYK